MRKLFKILGVIGLVLTVALVALALRGRAAATAVYDVDVRLIEALPDSVDAEEARRWAVVSGCTGCHGADLSGEVMIDAPPFLVVAPNLTSGAGGVASGYESIADWDRAIRYRIRPDGTGMLPMMPSENYHRMSDEHVALAIAAVRAAPPVDNQLPETEIRPAGLPIAGFGVLHPSREPLDAPGGPTPPAGATAAYGAYLSGLMCVECHGDDLRGGPTPGGGPKAPALATAGRWSYDAFVEAMTEGVIPGGRRLAEEMPWEEFAELNETELRALHAHLAELPPPGGDEE